MKANEFKIRDFAPDDYDEIMELWIPLGLGDAYRGDTTEVILRTIAFGGKFFVLEQISTKKIVGTAWITNDQRRLFIHHFGIHIEFQNQMLGTLLMIEVMKFAMQTKLQIKLEVHEQNFPAIALYEKFDFKSIGDYEVYINRDFTNLNEKLIQITKLHFES